MTEYSPPKKDSRFLAMVVGGVVVVVLVVVGLGKLATRAMGLDDAATPSGPTTAAAGAASGSAASAVAPSPSGSAGAPAPESGDGSSSGEGATSLAQAQSEWAKARAEAPSDRAGPDAGLDEKGRAVGGDARRTVDQGYIGSGASRGSGSGAAATDAGPPEGVPDGYEGRGRVAPSEG